ncbi:UNVERIFIED_CONTAM: hypothetical protein NCL1_41870 [Trichonephila clavipes]
MLKNRPFLICVDCIIVLYVVPNYSFSTYFIDLLLYYEDTLFCLIYYQICQKYYFCIKKNF